MDREKLIQVWFRINICILDSYLQVFCNDISKMEMDREQQIRLIYLWLTMFTNPCNYFKHVNIIFVSITFDLFFDRTLIRVWDRFRKLDFLICYIHTPPFLFGSNRYQSLNRCKLPPKILNTIIFMGLF